MAKLVVFYSRADENYFGGKYLTPLIIRSAPIRRWQINRPVPGLNW